MYQFNWQFVNPILGDGKICERQVASGRCHHGPSECRKMAKSSRIDSNHIDPAIAVIVSYLNAAKMPFVRSSRSDA